MAEQRYRAVLEVQAGVSVTEVAERFGVSRQAAGRSSRPRTSPGKTASQVEAVLGRNDCPGRVPSRITIHRVLIRHGLDEVVPAAVAARTTGGGSERRR